MKFLLRPDQGDPSGFDLGDMFWRGELGEVASVGHVPDQGMMIWISITDLLDSVHELLTGRSGNVSFIGADCSFRMSFKTTREAVSVRGPSGPVARVGRAELAEVVLSAAEELAREHLSGVPPQDGVADDYVTALERFRLVARATRQEGASLPLSGFGTNLNATPPQVRGDHASPLPVRRVE
ncbi:hypothetical protein ACIQNK_20950 [Streptomyces sp. NPDC091273]|uniref:hypothetical protein n=1 Tax=Streptomyces sp. NPDC091273 TaxID=3365982 RepID=UPI00382F70C2